MQQLIFFIVILCSNIIQGITGFAGTILAMPISLIVVGYDVAKPVLNVLGILSGIYVLIGHYKAVNYRELFRILSVMIVGVIGGFYLKDYFIGKEKLLYMGLGIFIIAIASKGLYKEITQQELEVKNPIASFGLVLSAGIIHGMFVCGGPLLTGYLSKRIREKTSFRATISSVWVILNTFILLSDFQKGLWNSDLVNVQLKVVPALFIGMFIGTKLYVRMSQKVFVIITNVLLILSGVLLVIK